MVADCVPIVLVDNKNGIICALHAGRQGAFLNIAANAIEIMRERLKADVISAFLGPSIKACCYEIKDEVLCEARENFAFAVEEKEGKYFLDLRKILKTQLNKEGVETIIDDDICVCCDNRYFSHRREGVCGRFAVGVKLI
jgi:YfiH family protein